MKIIKKKWKVIIKKIGDKEEKEGNNKEIK